jgi:hypothetical protein
VKIAKIPDRRVCIKIDGSRTSTSRCVMLLDDASIRKTWLSKIGLRNLTLQDRCFPFRNMRTCRVNLHEGQQFLHGGHDPDLPFQIDVLASQPIIRYSVPGLPLKQRIDRDLMEVKKLLTTN